MCKRLMLLVCVVGVFGLAGIVSAAEIDWIDNNFDYSFCNPDNWDPYGVPGPGDQCQINPAGPNPTRGPIVDCVVVIDSIRGGPDGDMAIDWVSGGDMTVNDWDERWGTEGGGVATFNFLGGYLTILEERFRIGNENSNIVINISGDFVLNLPGGDWRFADNDDMSVDWNMDGGTINITDGSLQLGDDGAGTMDFTGGTLDIGEHFRIICRKTDQTVNIGGTTDIYIDRDLRISENGGRKDFTTCLVNMTGGTVNADRINIFDDEAENDSVAELNLSGGLLIARDRFEIPDRGDGSATVSITGGVLQCGDIVLDDDDSVVDVNGPSEFEPDYKIDGVIIIDGDKRAKIMGYAAEGKITGNGSPRGVRADYDVINTGKTTVWLSDNICPPWLPTPADGAVHVVVDVLLEWMPGEYLGGRGRHGLYLSDDYDEVEAASGVDPPFVAWILVPGLSYDTSPLALELWKTYYWRIDEIGESPCPLGVGEVWTFTTGCELIDGDLNLDCVVDFKDYALWADVLGDEAFFP